MLGRVLDLDLVNKGLRRRLAEYLVEAGLEDPVAWTRDIVLDRRNWDLSFDKWEFGSEIAPDRVTFIRVETDLSVVTEDDAGDDRLVDLIGQQVLAPTKRRKLGVVLEVDPHPRQVQGLDHFTVQIIAKEAGTGRCVTEGQGLEAGQDPCHGFAAEAQSGRLRRRLASRARVALDRGRRPDSD